MGFPRQLWCLVIPEDRGDSLGRWYTFVGQKQDLISIRTALRFGIDRSGEMKKLKITKHFERVIRRVWYNPCWKRIFR